MMINLFGSRISNIMMKQANNIKVAKPAGIVETTTGASGDVTMETALTRARSVTKI